jgi:uncharacterized LabA/DUF88 family protein
MEYVYVDNSNVFIEARRVSAVAQGLARNIQEAMNLQIVDPYYTIDFGKLHQFVAGTDKKQIARATLFGSRPPPNDSIWTFAEKAGFDVILVDRNFQNKEKKVDTGIVTAMVKDAYKNADPSKDTITLVAGDGDFVPAFTELKKDGFTVDCVFWDHASPELKKLASNFISLNQHLKHLELKKKKK